jgi:peptide/nickel transport system substrate-binding protein
MAVDRHSIMRNVADTLAIPSFGPVTSAQFSADTTVVVPPFDTAAASALLDSLGWAKGSDGVRRRAGAKLTFALAFPSSSASRRQMAALLQAQWKSVGVDAQIEEIEPSVFFQRLGTGDYDAVINAWHADPSPSSARQGWSRDALPERGGSNFGGYQSAEFDALIDSAAASFDLARSRALYRRAYERLAADVPAIWLYEPKYAAAAHRRLRVSGMRADAWWAGLADWSVYPGKRIARDRLGLVAAATGR